MNNELPNVQIYSIGPDEVNYAAALLTGEAIDYIKNHNHVKNKININFR